MKRQVLATTLSNQMAQGFGMLRDAARVIPKEMWNQSATPSCTPGRLFSTPSKRLSSTRAKIPKASPGDVTEIGRARTRRSILEIGCLRMQRMWKKDNPCG